MEIDDDTGILTAVATTEELRNRFQCLHLINGYVRDRK